MRPAEGMRIDGFTLGPRLHKGGFATIWPVTHPDHALPMVMKVPTILDGFDGPTIVGFEVEQMILPRLSGPHVPRVIASGGFDPMPYLVTEAIPGTSLQPLFNTAPLALDRALDLARRMAAAVHDLHRQQVIHLDLKPGNMMTRPDGTIVCIDFGLAHSDLLPDLLAEEFASPMGSFPYIAPEQILGRRDDLRSDVFALGAMLYQLVTGRLPFGDPPGLRGARRRLWRDPLPPRAIDPTIPPWLQEVILRALAVDPAERTASAAQLLFDLEQPEKVALTARATRMTRDGFWAVWRRRRRMGRLRSFARPPGGTAAQIMESPVLIAAVDLAPDMERLSERILNGMRDLLSVRPQARVACVNVIRTHRIGIDTGTDDEGRHLHVSRLVALQAWGQRLGLPEDRVTFTVLEGTDPAGEILDHARRIMADHIMMGARASSSTRRYLGSVSSRVVAEAPCDVTVLRLPQPGG
ncbi:bifunctional serine/threonine-protein kinase/universal stress protein [Paracoccus sp. TOH]|uniref:Bifunctional serine/threonine-protein kinase/universal stress protein n=1 Tax=Paracoccus simplex TaxID=2086346 RepID=A0ABV7S3V4_9RHOB|nr:bifunctional serine/threonine-protein kinase/universal stress protein [Paracoccus sp. TOH]WJS83425.1 bifunctional serine/threonine-protein kinase/universal stress protein [Paracoccus sp. TOH]